MKGSDLPSPVASFSAQSAVLFRWKYFQWVAAKNKRLKWMRREQG